MLDLDDYQTTKCPECNGLKTKVYACCPGACPHSGRVDDCDRCGGEGRLPVPCPRCAEPLKPGLAICELCVAETVADAAE